MKATSRSANHETFELYEREAAVMAVLGCLPHVPGWVGAREVADGPGSWLVIALRAVAGACPGHPWAETGLRAPLDAWLDVQAALPATPGADHVAAESLSGFFTGWSAIAAERSDDWSRWATCWAPREAELGQLLAAGDALAHGDLRADNLLIGLTGVWFLDWVYQHAA